MIPTGRLRLVTVKKKHHNRGETIRLRRNTGDDRQDTAQQTPPIPPGPTHHKNKKTNRQKHFEDLKAKADTHTRSRRTQLTPTDVGGFFGDLSSQFFICSFHMLAPICHSVTSEARASPGLKLPVYTAASKTATRTI